MDRQALITLMQRLQLYVDGFDDTYMTNETKFDLQLKYYAIVQIYLSPYKVYLNTIKEKKFTRLFLSAKKYCPVSIDDESKIEDFMNYFIKCIQNEMDKTDKGR